MSLVEPASSAATWADAEEEEVGNWEIGGSMVIRMRGSSETGLEAASWDRTTEVERGRHGALPALLPW
jgi:hypothetical protein